jgi:hypothetical protein
MTVVQVVAYPLAETFRISPSKSERASAALDAAA